MNMRVCKTSIDESTRQVILVVQKKGVVYTLSEWNGKLSLKETAACKAVPASVGLCAAGKATPYYRAFEKRNRAH